MCQLKQVDIWGGCQVDCSSTIPDCWSLLHLYICVEMLLASGGGHNLQGLSFGLKVMDKEVVFEEFRHMQMIAMKPLVHVLTFEADALLLKFLSEVTE
jgi:hypothetical protein